MSKGSTIRPRRITDEQWNRLWDDIFAAPEPQTMEIATHEEPVQQDQIRHRLSLRPPTLLDDPEAGV